MQNKFKELKSNLRDLNTAKSKNNTVFPKLRISTVGMLDMLDQLIPAVEFAKEFKASEGLQITHLKAHGTDMVPLMPLHDPEAFQLAVDKAASYGQLLGVKVDQQGGTIEENQRETALLGHRICNMPWHRLSIQPDGEVYPCPLSSTVVGNIYQQPIQEIWFGEALANFRSGVNDVENPNKECKHCTHCRHRNVLDPVSNDFSTRQNYVAGMTRKP